MCLRGGVSIYYIVNIYCRPSVYYRLIVGLLGFRPNLLVLHILSIYRQLHVLNITLNIIYTELILLISVSAFSLSSLRFSPSSLCFLSLFLFSTWYQSHFLVAFTRQNPAFLRCYGFTVSSPRSQTLSPFLPSSKSSSPSFRLSQNNLHWIDLITICPLRPKSAGSDLVRAPTRRQKFLALQTRPHAPPRAARGPATRPHALHAFPRAPTRSHALRVPRAHARHAPTRHASHASPTRPCHVSPLTAGVDPKKNKK